MSFAIAAKRNTALWRAYYAGIAADQRTDAIDMDHAQVATCGPAPPVATGYLHHRAAGTAGGRHRHLRRPPRTATAHYSTDQLTSPSAGTSTRHMLSFIVTNIPTYDSSDDGRLITDIEHWFPPPHRHRRTHPRRQTRSRTTSPTLRKPELNTVWMWAALLAINISVLLQAVTGIDDHGRRHAHACAPN